MKQDDINALKNMGYRCTSRNYGMLARVDRPDWREYMAARRGPTLEEGMRWVNMLGNGAADHYRRVYSNDKIHVHLSVVSEFPNSSGDTTGFVKDTRIGVKNTLPGSLEVEQLYRTLNKGE